jgi:ribosome maturation factor RimP
MTEQEIIHVLTGMLSDLFAEEGNRDHFLVEMSLKGKKLEVFLDSDSAITFDVCRMVSRFLEAYLDEQGLLGDDYLLEVSSAGVGRPLLLPRQFQKNVGRWLQVTDNEGQPFLGQLSAATEKDFTVTWTTKEKVGKKNVTVTKEMTWAYPEIKKAIVKLTTS